MEEIENKGKGQHPSDSNEANTSGSDRQEIFSRTVRAGKRTYFFDVKSTRAGEYYLTITESKRRFNNDQGKFFYEKHKLFLYKEDFEKFAKGLNTTIDFIQTGNAPEEIEEETVKPATDPHTDIDFEDLDNESTAASKDSEEEDKDTQ
ncbi:MAG: PUR family DNA/RNA-binding protein [Bacteroidetes bacterium]|nr:PUR family DNA/RNA-binding protein [Bacteroidota bacterium]